MPKQEYSGMAITVIPAVDRGAAKVAPSSRVGSPIATALVIAARAAAISWTHHRHRHRRHGCRGDGHCSDGVRLTIRGHRQVRPHKATSPAEQQAAPSLSAGMPGDHMDLAEMSLQWVAAGLSRSFPRHGTPNRLPARFRAFRCVMASVAFTMARFVSGPSPQTVPTASTTKARTNWIATQQWSIGVGPLRRSHRRAMHTLSAGHQASCRGSMDTLAARWMYWERSARRTYLAACVLSVCSRASASGAPSAAAVWYQFAASAGSGLTPTAPSWVRKAGS